MLLISILYEVNAWGQSLVTQPLHILSDNDSSFQLGET